MRDLHQPAEDGEEIHWRDGRGQHIVSSWHAPDLSAPEGRSHGSAGVCFTPEGDVVLVTWPGVGWEFPAGRPEEGEDWRATLDREVLEEACASVEDATLLGFARGECIEGPEEGLVLVRALWHARVALNPWEPWHETTGRLAVPPEEALERVGLGGNLRRIYERWFRDALAVEWQA